ncbi:MAG: flavin reductase family protein [Thermoleophilia bacterium]
MKIERKPSTSLLPVPVVLLSVADGDQAPNIITLAWVGTVCSDPPMVSVSIRPSRYSYRLVTATRDFVINIPHAAQVALVDGAGTCSGIEHDKFSEFGFTARPSNYVTSPMIEECPINIECVVRHQLSLGAHDAFIAEIVATHYDEDLLDERGRLRTRNQAGVAYVDGEYWSLGERLGSYGRAAKSAREHG